LRVIGRKQRLLWYYNMRLSSKILKFASIFCAAASADTHRWAAGIVQQAFRQVMGRNSSPAELQIVMAVSSLESGYGKGWGKGQSTAGQGSHNWGAIQTANKKDPQFQHRDSSAQGSYVTGFKAYPDDVAGAADVVRYLFKSGRKQRIPNPANAFRALGPDIPGPSRGDLVEQACQQGDILAFSKAMWYTGYYEGTALKFTDRIMTHARGMQQKLSEISGSLGGTVWSIKSDNFLPVTNDSGILQKVQEMIGGAHSMPVPMQPSLQGVTPAAPASTSEDAFESSLWFQ
jgi:hypothetical protein